MKVIIGFCFILISIFFSGCTSPRTNCIKPGMENLKIRWGTHYARESKIEGYQISTDMTISEFFKDSTMKEYKYTNIGNVNTDSYCRIVDSLETHIRSIQALFTPGDTSRFIEYNNPSSNMQMRVMWNVKFDTYGSREFRRDFDTLQTFIQR